MNSFLPVNLHFSSTIFFHIRSAAVVFLWHYSRNTCHVRVLLLEVRCIRIEFLPEPADVWSPNSVCVIDIPSWVNTSPHWQYWHFYLVAYCAASQIFVVSFHFQKKNFHEIFVYWLTLVRRNFKVTYFNSTSKFLLFKLQTLFHIWGLFSSQLKTGILMFFPQYFYLTLKFVMVLIYRVFHDFRA